ncbi:MAG: UDP-N-acetylmuramate dehydrogenase [Clostridia bacterium]|nr:UDP-N-acetylmuramate dehydrogenase [Clostridia bacterium]
MNSEAISCRLRENGISFCCNEPMWKHTTFHIGGNADVFVSVASAEELKKVLAIFATEKIPYYCIGRGSNILVADEGIAGAVISLAEMKEISVMGTRIRCDAGSSLAALCTAARDAGLAGLEFGYGIPGSVGGALVMNAGAYGGEIKDIIVSAEVLNADGTEKTVAKEEMMLGYRQSVFQGKPWIITAVTVELKPGNRDEISAKMEELMNRRKAKQPLEYPSAGSTFRRPEGYFAGALIEKNGLKGLAVGDAEVSRKHAGFVINKGHATAEDVQTLIRKIQDTVYKADGVLLQPEVIFIGEKHGEKR